MSYNKNTVDASNLDAIEKVLKGTGEVFNIYLLGEVAGKGVNDESNATHPLRRLEYRDTVVLERMERTYDCDCDDMIVSQTFKKTDEPKEWPLEIWLDADEYESIEEFDEEE